ncbi:MAG TPA: hypothetical protein VGB77_02180 [Abditibacteriaceae bacterium]|jgi:hypothetical protein
MSHNSKPHLSADDLKKLAMALSLFIVLLTSGFIARQKLITNQQNAATIRQMNLEMGRTEDASLTSPPEEEAQRTNPHFQP